MHSVIPAAAVAAIVVVAAPALAQAERQGQGQGPSQPNPWAAGSEKSKGIGKYAKVNGIDLYYEIHGSGKPLVLLHGGLGAIEMFGPNLAALAKGRQVIAVDLQGHGRTADIDRPISTAFMADDVAALIEHLGLGRADVMGYSLGGGVAVQVAVRHPDVVDRLVLASTPMWRDAFYPDILAQQAHVNAAAAEALKQTPMYQMYVALAPRPQDWARLLDKMGEAMKSEQGPTKEQVAGIKAAALIVAADADIFPPSHAVEVFGLLGGGQRDGGWDGSGRPKSRLAILPGLTHYTLFNAPALAETVIAFLDEAPAAAPARTPASTPTSNSK